MRRAHPATYIVESLCKTPASWGQKEAFLGGGPGGARGVQFSSASHGLNAVSRQFVLPLEAAQKGLFFRTPVFGLQDPL